MAFQLNQEQPPMYTSPTRLYLTPAGQVSGEPVSGGTLLVPAGGALSNAEAARYGLGEKQVMPPENKARRGVRGKASEE